MLINTLSMKAITNTCPILFLLILFGCVAPKQASQDTATLKNAVFSQKYPYTMGKLKSKTYYIYQTMIDTVYADGILETFSGAGEELLVRNMISSKYESVLVESNILPDIGVKTHIVIPATSDTLVSYIQRGSEAHSIRLKGQEGTVFQIYRGAEKWVIMRNEEVVGNWTIVDMYKKKSSAVLLELNYQPFADAVRSWELFTFAFATEQIVIERAANSSGGGGFWGFLFDVLLAFL